MNFNEFKVQLNELMFLDNLDESIKEEYFHDWYILFKQQGHDTIPEFVAWQFPSDEVNKSTHEFWAK